MQHREHRSRSPAGAVPLRLEQPRPLDVARLLTIIERTCAHICTCTWMAGKHSEYELPATGGATEGRRPLSPEQLLPSHEAAGSHKANCIRSRRMARSRQCGVICRGSDFASRTLP